MNIDSFLSKVCSKSGISGHELKISEIVASSFKNYVDEIIIDKLGNLIAVKKGENNINNLKIMIAAHIDEIGLMVTDIDENGFISFTKIGGIDPRTLLAQEVIVHGKNDFFGVIGAKPPHLQDPSSKENAIKIDDLVIDVGFSREELNNLIQIGDVISIKRNIVKLQNDRISGKALDDRAGIAVMLECAKELLCMKHESDVYFVSTVQEEVGSRGATVSTFRIDPDIGIAIDVGFGSTPDLSRNETIEVGNGPAITIGGNIHPGLRKKIIEVAKEYNIPYQYEVSPGQTGTDARVMQITKQGIPCLLISIPLRYMHTSVEVVDIKDIKNAAKLLSRFISVISSKNLEGLLCF